MSDFRVIACTNTPPEELKHDVLPRFDYQVVVRPLDARRADVPLLLRHRIVFVTTKDPALVAPFLRDGDPTRAVIEPWLVERLVRMRYTKNARELNNILSAALASARSRYIGCTPPVLKLLDRATPPPRESEKVDATTLTLETIEAALRASGQKRTLAADYLGVDRNAFSRAMKRVGLK